jgi:Xaa-Pro aminopeptidase
MVLKQPQRSTLKVHIAIGDAEFGRRGKKYRDLMAGEGLEGLLVSHLADVRYLCGFSGSNGMVLLLGDRGYFLTDFRYREQSAHEVRGLKVAVYAAGLEDSLARLLEKRPETRLGFDPASLFYAEVLLLRRRLKGIAVLRPVQGSLALLRASKSRSEVKIIRSAIRIAQEAFAEALGQVGEGTREAELAAALDMAARKRGAEAPSFETIVASGPRGAMVHAAPSGRRLRGMTLVDWGVIYRGYCTDMTRTLAFGKIPAPLKKAHALVLEAQQRALERIRPGTKARDVDKAARDIIEEAGYGPAFGHGLGHGVGLEVHERPHVSRASRDVIEEGMVFTVEPGIYLPGVGGVRVEDMVLVTNRGAEVLTTLPRGLDPAEY